MSLTNRFPAWLYNALRLQEPEIPVELDDTIIQSVGDVWQGGRAFSLYIPFEFTQGASDPDNETFVIIPADEDFIHILWLMQYLNSSVTASIATWDIRDSLGSGRVIRILETTLPANTLVTSGQIGMLGTKGVFLPPRWEMRVDFAFGTGVAESRVVTGVYERIPRGFNPSL